MIRALLTAIMIVYTAAAFPQPQDRVLQSVDFQQKLGGRIPLKARFLDDGNQMITLGGILTNRKPVLLMMGYYECPMLCGVVQGGLMESLKDLDASIGQDFDVVFVSIDPSEDAALAERQKTSFLQGYSRDNAAEGVHFLTGDQQNIDRVAESIGFVYTYDKDTDQYAHPAGFVVVSPSGRISQYFYGVAYDTAALRQSIADARSETVGSPVQQLLLRCFHYDPTTGKYGSIIMTVMRSAGALFVVLLLGGVGFLAWRRSAPKGADDG
jgi:protein SCO1/2